MVFFGKFQTDLKLAEHLTGIFVENVEPIRCVCVCVCVCARFLLPFFSFTLLAAPSLLAEEFLLLTSVISVIYVILYKTLYSR